MATLSISPYISEHWLTIMMCTICEQTPDSSPLYKCNMGHLVCGPCFEKLARIGIPRCKKCSSLRFKQQHVPRDFLCKLKARPGIGRPRRYQVFDLLKSTSETSETELKDHPEKNMTVEKLFQLTTEQLKHLFVATAKEKSSQRRTLKPKTSLAFITHSSLLNPKNEKLDGGSPVAADHDKSLSSNRVLVEGERGFSSTVSRKPVICPHSDCRKVVTNCSFFQHFQHDHPEIPVFCVERGKELHLLHDVRGIEFNTTYCMAVIKVDEPCKIAPSPNSLNMLSSVTQKSIQRLPAGTFWLMVSGSIDEKKAKSFVLYWLLTNSEEHFSCTIEMASLQENFSASIFCAVNRLFDSHNVIDVAYRLNCLNLCYGSMHNLLEEGAKLHLRVTVH